MVRRYFQHLINPAECNADHDTSLQKMDIVKNYYSILQHVTEQSRFTVLAVQAFVIMVTNTQHDFQRGLSSIAKQWK